MDTIIIPPPPPLVSSTKQQPRFFSFDPFKNFTNAAFQNKGRALANMKPCYQQLLDDYINKPDDIFQALWSGIPLDEAAPSPETRIALGVVGFLAHLATKSHRVRTLLENAPDRPNYEFSIVNALLATIKYTAKPVTDVELSTLLLKKTLQFLVSHTAYIPDVGKPSVDAPFPTFALFTHSFIDLMCCTPRLTVDYQCAESNTEDDDSHKFGYRLQGHFLDALHVAPNETSTLAEILEEFESELIQGAGDVPYSCSRDHQMQVHSYSYGSHGPPPLLFFEAIDKKGIPRQSITEHVSLGDSTYVLASIVSLEVAIDTGIENDLVLQVELMTDDDGGDEGAAVSSLPIALVVYTRMNVLIIDNNNNKDEEDEQEEALHDSIEEEAALDGGTDGGL